MNPIVNSIRSRNEKKKKNVSQNEMKFNYC